MLNRAVSCSFTESNQDDPDVIGVLFEIIVDSIRSSISFAKIHQVSYHQEDEEALFSMHSVFRIGQTNQIHGNNRLWQVDLTLTNDNDPQLRVLTECMRNETFPTAKGWYRLSYLLVQLGLFNKAEQVCKVTLDQNSTDTKKTGIYLTPGKSKRCQGEHSETIKISKKSIEIVQEIPSPNNLYLSASYHHLGIYEKTLPCQHSEVESNSEDTSLELFVTDCFLQ